MSRSIALGLVAVVTAFALAFGVGKAAGGKSATAGVKAAAIKVAGAPAVQSVELGGSVPALKSTAKKTKKKTTKKKAPSSNNNSTPAPSNDNDSSPAPSTPSTPKPSTPKPSTPKPAPKPPVVGNGDDGGAPVTGGNEDG